MNKKRISILWVTLGTITICLTAYLALKTTSARTHEAETTQQDTIHVRAERLELKQVSFPIRTSGIVASKQESRLGFKTGGIIEAVYVEAGDRVNKGQLLAQLNLEEVQANVRQAEASYDKAKRDLERARELYADTVGTLEALQNAESAFSMAESQLRIARFNLQHASIYAPASGHILYKHASDNELVSPGQPVVSFASGIQQWVVKAGVSDKEIVNLQTNDSARVELDAYPGRKTRAIVTQIASAPDPASGLYEVELTLLSDQLAIKSGFFANVHIYPSRKETLFMVPAKALVRANGNKGMVYTVSPGERTPVLNHVQIKKIGDDMLAIQQGLKSGDYVVTEGYTHINENTIVQFDPDRNRSSIYSNKKP